MKRLPLATALLLLAPIPALAQGLAGILPAPDPNTGAPGLPHSFLLEPMRGLLNQANAPVKKPAPTPPRGQIQSYGNGISVPPPAVPPLPPQDQPYQ